MHITSKNQSSLPSYIAKPIAGRTSIPGHSASPDTFLQMEKIRRWGDSTRGWVERRGAGGAEVGRVHRIERGASKRARGGVQRARGWVARRSQSSGGAGRRRRRRRCSAGKEEEDRREGEKPQRASGWYIADQYNCTLVLINNRRWERKKRAMQQQQRRRRRQRRWWRQRTQHTNNTRYISRPGWLCVPDCPPPPPSSPLFLAFFSSPAFSFSFSRTRAPGPCSWSPAFFSRRRRAHL